MEIAWNISDEDVKKVVDYVNQQSSDQISNRIARNINFQGLLINRDTILHSLLYSLLLSNQRQESFSHITSVFSDIRYKLQYLTIIKEPDKQNYVSGIIEKHNISLAIKETPDFFASNFDLLEATNWELLDRLIKKLCIKESKKAEREIADHINSVFKGFGPYEARVFLQTLGLTKFEIPIDSFVSDWLIKFNFPVEISPTALQERNFYHLVSDGVQLLCKNADVYPCVLEAAIHAVNFRKQFEVM